MTYEQAFAAGERAAFDDRKAGRARVPPAGVLSPFGRAFWDAYVPRSTAWAMTSKPVKHWQEEGETA